MIFDALSNAGYRVSRNGPGVEVRRGVNVTPPPARRFRRRAAARCRFTRARQGDNAPPPPRFFANSEKRQQFWHRLSGILYTHSLKMMGQCDLRSDHRVKKSGTFATVKFKLSLTSLSLI